MSVLSDRIQYWRKRQAKQKAQNQRMVQQARSQLVDIVNVLVEKFQVTKVIVFGSLVKDKFTAESDIDLAVEGINKTDFFAALSEVNRQTDRWVDLKPIEDLDPHFRQRVFETGECIYEADFSKSNSGTGD
ncbi:nucleotidyltransferase domain protein [Lyngbya aestuarii BL J]|uniref:Nucleotidyltransferase domain protein n=1 Tax=Lyngbya aestuarii BL J TaxID=1348334 RepID=U7Q9J1_9CYAN|nr:nucleotidyltransferase domain-containing protein [Lyngbya aestuarii]ERT04479.1 nucleotidyltransferase domain protein [Lyngbya aestuarii BL J]